MPTFIYRQRNGGKFNLRIFTSFHQNWGLEDIDCLLGRGEVPGLFTTKEKNELNEVEKVEGVKISTNRIYCCQI